MHLCSLHIIAAEDMPATTHAGGVDKLHFHNTLHSVKSTLKNNLLDKTTLSLISFQRVCTIFAYQDQV